MANEAGDMKLLGNFRKLIDLVKTDPNYKPSNDALKPAALDAQYIAALAAVQDVAAKAAPNKTAINDREIAFNALSPTVTRAHNLAKASGASPQHLEDLNTSKRKLSGARKSAKVKADPKAASDSPSTKNVSASQMSFDNRLGNLRTYLALLGQLPDYDPNEADLKLTALGAFADDLQARNDAVSATFVPLSQARGLRDQLLYQADNCVVNTALLAKSYASGAVGNKGPLYKQIKSLSFERKRG